MKQLRMTKKPITMILISCILTVSLLALLTGCSGATPKTFQVAGMEITLTNQFRETKPEGFTMCFDSKEMAVFTMKEVFALSEGLDQHSVTEYGALLLEVNGLSGKAEIQSRDGLNFFEFTNTNASTGVEYHYVCYFFKASDAFWSVQFAVEKENLAELRPIIETYAQSITFQ